MRRKTLLTSLCTGALLALAALHLTLGTAPRLGEAGEPWPERRTSVVTAALAQPLTCVAGAPSRVAIAPEDAPQRRLAALSPGKRSVAEPRAVAPSLMPDPHHPPQWTMPLATPAAPRPPDPFVLPSLAVDASRGR
jgi:hypothetical protein